MNALPLLFPAITAFFLMATSQAGELSSSNASGDVLWQVTDSNVIASQIRLYALGENGAWRSGKESCRVDPVDSPQP